MTTSAAQDLVRGVGPVFGLSSHLSISPHHKPALRTALIAFVASGKGKAE
ncbi:MAG: hypothetical protein LC097_00165 [Burkholderiales bacterium]|nr:hypothetical protein [Burkholderiales bacterium]